MAPKASMRAAVYRERGVLTVEERPVPAIGDGEVLVRVSHCGVCGTDLHLVLDGWGRADSIGGHEYSGTVEAVGASVAEWKVGDRVVGSAEAGCGDCEYCATHRPSLCLERGPAGVAEFQGAFAEYRRVSAGDLHRIPDGVGMREAALTEPLAVALHGITLSRIRPGQRALVTGAGPIGLLTLAALRAVGVRDVLVSEPSPVRRALAERIGASQAVAPDGLDRPPMPFTLVDDARDVAFECSGRPDAFRAALCQLRKAGRLVVLGTGMEPPRLDTNRVLLNELVVTGAYEYDENGFDDALELLASGDLPTDLLIEATDVGLDDLLGAMQGLAAGRIGGKVLVAPG